MKCETLLDVCCGEEYSLLKSLKDRVDDLYGIDSEVKESVDGNIHLRREYLVKALNYPSIFFDIVVMSAAVEHLEYPIEILEEVYRILKHGGKLLLTTPEPSADRILKALSFMKLSELDEDSHKYYFSKEDMSKILTNIGFDNIIVIPFEFKLNKLVISQKTYEGKKGSQRSIQ